MFALCSYQTKIEFIWYGDKCKSSSCVLLAILLQCISKENTASCFLTFFVFIMSPVVSELTLHTVCLCFKFRHLTKQIPTLHNINLVSVLSIGYFIHLLLLLLQHGDTENNPGPKNKQVNNLFTGWDSI